MRDILREMLEADPVEGIYVSKEELAEWLAAQRDALQER